jgi:hypothetical protein
VFVVFWITSMVEGLAGAARSSPSCLPTSASSASRTRTGGVRGPVLGPDLRGRDAARPALGVWADKYSRKAVVARSALVEAVVFACVALSRGAVAAGRQPAAHRVPARQHRVMLAAIRDVVPPRRIGP